MAGGTDSLAGHRCDQTVADELDSQRCVESASTGLTGEYHSNGVAGLVWYGLMRCGAVWFGLVWQVGSGMVRSSKGGLVR